MIFNPLFINENGTSQMLVSKPGKLSQNKYLFSDIVKVVMNPSQEQKEILTDDLGNEINPNVKMALDGDQNPVKLKFKFLSDDDNEQAKLDLADILPEDIAQLLVNDEAILDEEKAISYISKEPLKGELQNFLNGLIGAEIIEKNISNDSGLLLSMEDKKSAVNLELVKGNGNKKANGKIIVQTLVVPEKSKLLSLMRNGENKKGLINANNSPLNQGSADNINAITNTSDIENSKPTLSVYSFKHGGEEFESLTKNIKTNSSNKHNLTVLGKELNKVNVETQKVPLEKISFIPSELKNQTMDKMNSVLETKNELKTNMGDLKLFIQNNGGNEKDFSVSKITIVKKKGEISSSGDSKLKNNVSGKEIESALKRIDFTKKIETQNSKINQLSNFKAVENTNSSTKPENISTAKTNNDLSSQLKVLKNNEQSGLVNKLNTPSTTKSNLTEDSLNKLNLAESTKSKELLTKTDSNYQDSKVNETKNASVDSSLKSSNSLKEESQLKVYPAKVLENKSNENLTNVGKAIKDNVNHLTESGQLKKTETNASINQQVDKNNDSVEKNNTEPKITAESKATNLNFHESDINKVIKGITKNNLLVKGELKVTGTTENVDTKLVNEAAVNFGKIDSNHEKQNKKVSVKVRGEIKTISDKNESKSSVVEESRPKGESSHTGQNNTENGNANLFRNTAFPSDQFEVKSNHENSFQHVLNKEEIPNFSNAKEIQDIDVKSGQRLVKAAEVVKELSRFISKQERGSFSFDITPEHLGKMKISLETREHVLRAHIEVENEQSKQLIEKNLDKLHQELRENGVELGALNISLGYSKQQKDENEDIKEEKNQLENNGQMGEAEEEKEQKTLGYNTYEYIA